MVGQIGQLGTLHFGLTMMNVLQHCQRVQRLHGLSYYEMQAMIGSFATPDGADWGEANIEEMNEVIQEAI